jgi:2-polyprenyl-3-methyl-5-hydroxy-6-metoxy-1,4-benzoquinol methylase
MITNIPIPSDLLSGQKEMMIKIEELTTMPKVLKIGVGIPAGKVIDTEFTKILLERLKEWTKDYLIHVYLHTIIPLDRSRNEIVEYAKKDNCDYLFFIDSDIIIGEGQLNKLLSHNKDAISGVYYRKVIPYEPLPRKKVAKNLYRPIEFDGDEIFEIDGTGFGCFLLKMDIFDKIPYPWFEFKYICTNGKWGQPSEDLLFCQKLQDTGTKIYCDPSVQCPHIGISLDKEISRMHKAFRLDCFKETDKIALELSEFTGMSSEDIFEKWTIATELVAKEFNDYKKSSNSNFDHKEFYKNNKNYIFDLTGWHIGVRRGFDVELVRNIKKDYSLDKKILDFGSGCGQNAIQLAEAGYDVSILDYDGYTSQFARFRAKKRELNIKFYDIEKPIYEKFDLILAFDVLEHIPDSEFESTVKLLKSLKRNGGKILTSISFGTQGGIHPMHYEENSVKIELIETLNK